MSRTRASQQIADLRRRLEEAATDANIDAAPKAGDPELDKSKWAAEEPPKVDEPKFDEGRWDAVIDAVTLALRNADPKDLEEMRSLLTGGGDDGSGQINELNIGRAVRKLTRSRAVRFLTLLHKALHFYVAKAIQGLSGATGAAALTDLATQGLAHLGITASPSLVAAMVKIGTGLKIVTLGPVYLAILVIVATALFLGMKAYADRMDRETATPSILDVWMNAMRRRKR